MPYQKTRIALRGIVTARIVEITQADDGATKIMYLVPIEPEALAVIEGRLQVGPRAAVATKYFRMHTGLTPTDDIQKAVGKYLNLDLIASRDPQYPDIWYHNRIKRMLKATPEQQAACKASLDRIIPIVEAKEKAEAKAEAEAEDTTITEADIPTVTIPYEDELPF